MAELVTSQEIFYTEYEPKLKNRYLMSFTGTGIQAFMVKSMNRPSIEFDEVVLEHMNVTRYVKGKGRWQPLEVTLYDPVVPSAAQAVMEWVRLSHESVTGRDGYSDFYKKDISFNVLGPVGDKVEQWDLKGAYIQAANFGDMAFESSDPAEISLTLRYDYAVLQF